MVKIRIILFCLLILLAGKLALGQKSNYVIGPDKLYIDANDLDYKNVKPGDTLRFSGGNYKYLLIKNFKGTPEKPIVMTNSAGEVIIDTDHYYGISIQNCRYFKFSGLGDPKFFYGFKIKRVANGAGIGIGDLSSDFEVDHVSIENCLIAGIYAKTDPDCSPSSVRGAFTQYNTIIHDNYIAKTGDEGMYIGSSKYSGQNITCEGKELILMPALLDGVKIYNNIIEYSGKDGIQVSSASQNCQVYNNTVLFDSQSETDSQMSGILLGGGSKCDCYNNFISQGKGNGIESHGLGGYRIFNNIIVNAGRSFATGDPTQMKHGIFVTDVSVQNDSTFFIMHNDIINPKSEGIRFSSIKSKKNQISGNVIINPGNFDYYENGNTSFRGKDAYVMFQNTASDVTVRNNYFARNASLAGFASSGMQSPSDFKLTAGSPLIDGAEVNKKISFDFAGICRPFGLYSDIGAFEFDAINTNNGPSGNILLENPVRDFLRIILPEGIGSVAYLTIYNLNGKLINIFEYDKITSENQIISANMSNLMKGIYLYRIQKGEVVVSGKFIKL